VGVVAREGAIWENYGYGMDSKQNDRTTVAATTAGPRWFTTTHWSQVLLAGHTDSSRAAKALEELCRAYWLPLYSYIRRQGYAPHDAQDLTQGFLVRLLNSDAFEGLSREKGKFRTFLLAALNHFLSDERDRARAQKRGGGQPVISIDETEAEERYLQMTSEDPAPERVFDRGWALTVLEAALARLREEHQAPGKGALFEGLSTFLSNEGSKWDYEAVAPGLGMSPGAVAVAVHRFRQRYRECIRLELAQTVANPEALDEEMNYLFSVLVGP
jgi:RNA polymerase sigma-70 factor (ECF subfamily)